MTTTYTGRPRLVRSGKLNSGTSHSGISSLLVQKTLLTSADVLTLYTTGIEVVPKPVAPKAILFERAIVQLQGGTTDYATDGDLVIYYADTGTAVSAAMDDWINDASGSGATNTIEAVGGDTAIQTVGRILPGEALKIHQLTANPTVGDRNLLVTVLYRIYDVRY